MKLLAFETATSMGSIAVMDSLHIYGEEILYSPKTHSEQLLPSVDVLLKRCNLDISDIDFFAISKGPGSFTGLRIGMATVKAFAQSKQKKVVGVSTLEAISLNGAFFDGIVCSILDAGQNEIYAAAYEYSLGEKRSSYLDETLCSPLALVEKLTNASSVLLIGDVAQSYPELRENPKFKLAPKHLSLPRASWVGTLAIKLAEQGLLINPENLVPSYIRIPQAQKILESKLKKSGV